LTGTVQEGSSTLRAGLVIRSASDADNLCPCRISRQRGLICAHSVAVGLHYLKQQSAPAVPAPVASKPAEAAPPRKVAALSRAADGELLELCLIFPPNLADALSRGKVSLYVEGKWRQGRSPLNALPMDVPFALGEQDAALLDTLEKINNGDTPAMLTLDARQFSEVLPRLTGHPRVTLGRSQPVDFVLETARPQFKLELAGGLAVLQAKLDCLYGGKSVQSMPAELLWMSDPTPGARRICRTRPAGILQSQGTGGGAEFFCAPLSGPAKGMDRHA
jgi:hypothetical protein